MSSGKIISGIMKILGKDEALRQMHQLLNLDGGPGSGNFGHKGRPGKVGGSGAGGGKQYRGGRADIGYYSSRKDWLNGLQGEKQHEAVKFVAAAKKLHDTRMEAKKKIESLWARGFLTREEADQRIKEAQLDTIQEDMTPEQFIMKECSEQDREQLLGMLKESRSWDDTKDRLKNENLSEEERKVLDYLDGNTNFSREKMKEAFRIRQQLEAKAMGIDVPVDIPDEIHYEAGTKERPAPPEPEGPDYSFYDDPQRGGYGGGGDADNLMRITMRAIGEPYSFTGAYSKDDFAEANQKLVDLIQYGDIEPKVLAQYGVRSIYELRNAMSTKEVVPAFMGSRKKFSYTPEMVGRLTDEEKQKVLDIVNSYYNKDRFVYRTFDKIEDLDLDVLARAEMTMWGATPRSNLAKQQMKDYILLQQKMMLGVEPRPIEEIKAAKNAEKAEKERARAEKVQKWKSEHTEEEIKKMYYPATVSGVQRGEPMNSEDADQLSANPNRNSHVGSQRGNCQTCVMAYELRRRGYNVTAKPRKGDAESQQDKLSHYDESGWIDPETGEDVEQILPTKKLNKATAAKWANDTIKEGERYELSVCWNYCRGAHVLIAEKENGVLTLVDPQSGKRRTGDDIVSFFGDIHLNSTASGNWRPSLRRIDNALPKQEYYDTILLTS